MSKSFSFYQYILTVRGAKGEAGVFADEAFDDLMFPKYETDYNLLSDYIENYGSADMRLSVFDELYDKYQEWLKF
ncbi:YozE family protein [Macrococcus equipercicus]|uniref:YozE family protein n=1 Tax=Macrococcus equipercicus TaxID=69967 RepID=A0A9Q9BLN8_9STAP|nr:YozE family protein [Macrococcus equipercicus]KAA1040231.1 YozE family protein [Macrococcus equipercicus]UTH12825.1 YozE family protein [Macrococcus equipercicus]